MSVGDPLCSTEHGAISQSCIQLVCDLHMSKSARWYDVITNEVINRLNKLPKIMEKADGANTTTCLGKPLFLRHKSFYYFAKSCLDLDLSSENKKALMYEVWPVLSVISGIDDGLRVGGRCRAITSSRSGVLLGMTHDNKVRVQWDDASEVSKTCDCCSCFETDHRRLISSTGHGYKLHSLFIRTYR